jgi:cobalt/nickel transport system permease protein
VKHGFLDHHSGVDSPIHRLDARAKIIVFFSVILIGVSTPPGSFRVFALLGLTLIALALLSKLPLLHLARKLAVILPFIFLAGVTIPFVKMDSVKESFSLGIGSVSVSLSVILLYSTTPFPTLIKGLDRLHAPRIFTVLVSFMYRYSFIIVDETQRMNRARDARAFGRTGMRQLAAIGNMVGTLFLRSFVRGERIYMAMLSRGYDGSMPGIALGSIGWGELAFLMLLPLLIAMRVLLG